MRHVSTAICALISAVFAASSPARADHTDERLDDLFQALRTGDAASAEETAAEIHLIWADSASDTVDLLMARAIVSIDNDQPVIAEALLDHVIGLSPSFAQGYALRGSLRLRGDDSAGAIEDFTRAVSLEPRHYEARIALAELYIASGDKSAAYEELQRALEWNPHEEHALKRARTLRRELDGQEI